MIIGATPSSFNIGAAICTPQEVEWSPVSLGNQHFFLNVLKKTDIRKITIVFLKKIIVRIYFFSVSSIKQDMYLKIGPYFSLCN